MQNISDKCNVECEHFEVGMYGTKFCTWCSERCPEEGCYKEEHDKKVIEGEGKFFFSL